MGLAVGPGDFGNYFGWSYGMESAADGAALCLPVTLFYVTFMLSSELATMIPHAGGPSASMHVVPWGRSAAT